MIKDTTFGNKDGFEKFGKSFQEKLCKLIMFDRPFADQIGSPVPRGLPYDGA